MEKCVHGRRKRNAVRGADEADRDGIDDGAVAGGNELIQPVAIPGRARDVDEGAALRRGLELALARRHEGAASSAISRKPRSSCEEAARCACARNTPSQKPEPSASIAASQSRSEAASAMSPASTAHSMPLE